MNGTPGSTGLLFFRALLGDPVVAKLAALTDRLEAADDTIAPLCDAVAAFEAALFAHTTNLGDYLSNAVLETETVCVRQAAAGQLSPVMEAALNSELNFLQKLCGLTLDTLLEAADRQSRELAFLPRWEARQLDRPPPTTSGCGKPGRRATACSPSTMYLQ